MLGYGLGLRSVHYDYVLTHWPREVDWFELITENYLAPGGRPRAVIRQIREHYPVVLHGLSFNIGTDEEPDWEYLRQLRQLSDEIQPEWVSDHLCWTGLDGYTSHDLLPISYNQESLARCAQKVDQIQEFLGRQIVLENPSIYVGFRSSTMSEADFINALVKRTGCEVLLDINNVYVSAFNLGLDPYAIVDALNREPIRQFHLAGHTHNGDHIIDTHDHAVSDEVWKLYAHACKRFGPVPTLLERDDQIPEFPELVHELQMAKQLQEQSVATLSAQESLLT